MTAAGTATRGEQRAAVRRALDAGTRRDNRYKPNFASPEMLSAAAALFVKRPRWAGAEGAVPRIEIAPGVVAVARTNRARREKTIARAEVQRIKEVDLLAAFRAREGRWPADPIPSREILGWSRKSRSRMRKTVGQIDWYQELSQERAPAMVTLTYPGDWLTVAPNGRASKKHLRKFRKAYHRAWGHRIHAFWKLEFQRRGAPHYHLFMVPPAGKSVRDTEVNGHWIPDGLPWKMWLSITWAACVDHPVIEEYIKHMHVGTGVDYDKGLRGRDPRRIAEYFTKDAARSAKEYQNIVPPEWQEPGQGPGRFWGYWGLGLRIELVELHERDAINASRILRRWFDAKAAYAVQLRPRYRGGQVDTTRCPDGRYDVIGLAGAQLVDAATPPTLRRVRRRLSRMRNVGGAGWISVNDGAAYASQLARALDIARDRPPDRDGRRRVPRNIRRQLAQQLAESASSAE